MSTDSEMLDYADAVLTKIMSDIEDHRVDQSRIWRNLMGLRSEIRAAAACNVVQGGVEE